MTSSPPLTAACVCVCVREMFFYVQMFSACCLLQFVCVRTDIYLQHARTHTHTQGHERIYIHVTFTHTHNLFMNPAITGVSYCCNPGSVKLMLTEICGDSAGY